MPNRPSPDKLLLPFNRPEYYSVPEALVSALCWRAFEFRQSLPVHEASGSADSSKSKPLGYMYHATQKVRKTVDVQTTRPIGQRAKSFGAELVAQGVVTDAGPQLLGETIAASILGVRIEQNGNQPASPMTPALALLQDLRGVTGKANPADYGEILEAMFTLGSRKQPTMSASEYCLNAMDHRLQEDSILAAIDSAVAEFVLSDTLLRRENVPVNTRAVAWGDYYPETPFVWFAETWETLNSEEWVEALPARVWVDWASTVLRLAVGLGFLWEYSWYEALGTALARNRIPDTFPELLNSVRTPLPWQSSRSAVSVRDVGAQIRTKLARGDVALRFLKSRMAELQKEPDFGELDAIGFLQRVAHEDHDLNRRLLAAKVPPQSLWETVRYGLQTRDSSGPHTDYFGILRPRGTRFLLVEPGTEWIAVIASLSCKVPQGRTNVRAVMRNLTRMGLQPEVADLISLLEKAGLARGSADADQAVIVQSAF